MISALTKSTDTLMLTGRLSKQYSEKQERRLETSMNNKDAGLSWFASMLAMEWLNVMVTLKHCATLTKMEKGHIIQ